MQAFIVWAVGLTVIDVTLSYIGLCAIKTSSFVCRPLSHVTYSGGHVYRCCNLLVFVPFFQTKLENQTSQMTQNN